MGIINSLKRFVREFRTNRDYIFYYINALEKNNISGTSLGYVWWFLDPLLNMGIYIILVRVAFNRTDPNFPVFFFSAMLVWRYFASCLNQGANSIRGNINICKDNYVPKFIFPLAVCVSSLRPFLFSLGIVFGLMLAFRIPVTVNMLYLPLLVVILFILSWTCAILCAHTTMFINDFSNILSHLIMIGMFATPIFYDINRIPEQYIFYMKLNPVGILTTSFRNIFTYGTAPPMLRLIYLTLFTTLMLIFSIHLLYKYDQVYNRIGR